MPAAPERTFRGQTAEQRRAARRAQLLDAALDLIGTDGWSAATMTAICARAGLTERYFYESFKDRDALYLALVEDLAAATREAALGAVAAVAGDPAATPEDRLRAVVRAFVAVLLDDPRRGRVALLEGLGSARVQARRRELLQDFGVLVQENAELFLGAPPADPRRLEVDVVLLLGGIAELLGRRLEGTLVRDDEELVERIVALALWMGRGA